jgi:undecaprenyl-diphosphatase
MGSMAVYGMLAFVGARLTHRKLLRYAIALLAALTVFLIGLSRIYFGVHYPTDVLGGYLAGAIWLEIAILIVLVAEDYARRRQQAQV